MKRDMKIYFAGSIRGGRDDRELYLAIIKELCEYGTVLTEHVGDDNLLSFGEADVTDDFIFNRDMDWVRESDVIVAEVTTPSLGVGYEIGQSESMKKPVLCLFREIEGKRISAMISGNSYVTRVPYQTIDEVRTILSEFFNR